MLAKERITRVNCKKKLDKMLHTCRIRVYEFRSAMRLERVGGPLFFYGVHLTSLLTTNRKSSSYGYNRYNGSD